MKLNDAHYIDTTPGSGPFAPPKAVTDYTEWFMARYRNSQGKDGNRRFYFGMAQKVNQIVFAARQGGTDIFSQGPYAGAAAAVFEDMVGDGFEVRVLAHDDQH